MIYKVKHFLVVNIIVIAPTFANKKYDIEFESKKLYGGDLRSVLQGFRRSPEYLQILETEMKDFTSHLSSMGLAIQTKYTKEMAKKIGEDFEKASNATKKANDDKPTDPPSTEKGARARKQFRIGDDIHEKHRFNIERQFSIKIEKESHETPTTTTENGIKRLEERAWELIPSLLHDEQITYRNMGYEYAGKVIHELIKAVSEGEGIDEEADPADKSTQLPGGGDTEKVTTVTWPSTVHEEHTVPPDPEEEPPTVAITEAPNPENGPEFRHKKLKFKFNKN